MKVNLLKAVALVLSGLLISCSKPAPVEDFSCLVTVDDVIETSSNIGNIFRSDGYIYPVSPSDEVEAFLMTYLPPETSSFPPGFDFGEKPSCFLINSTSELEEIVLLTKVDIPLIDFDRYTLIVGRFITGSPLYTYKDQKISFKSGRPVLTVTYEGHEGMAPCVMTCYNFWGLYDKLQYTEIELNLI